MYKASDKISTGGWKPGNFSKKEIISHHWLFKGLSFCRAETHICQQPLFEFLLSTVSTLNSESTGQGAHCSLTVPALFLQAWQSRQVLDLCKAHSAETSLSKNLLTASYVLGILGSSWPNYSPLLQPDYSPPQLNCMDLCSNFICSSRSNLNASYF